MCFSKDFKKTIFSINEKTFEDSSLAVFDYQFNQCETYREYCQYLRKSPRNVKDLRAIPFLPIELFKNFEIKSGRWKEVKVFKSSGTSKTGRSRHFIRDLEFYHKLSKHIYELHFPPLESQRITALLPSYLEQRDSSLISMVDHFISRSKKESGFFTEKEIIESIDKDENVILIGVAYALLSLAYKHKFQEKCTIIETGGMKGRGKEITRFELHDQIKKGLQVQDVWSEYGMTELLSQAYGQNGMLRFPSWAKTLIRDPNDPFTYLPEGRTGGLNIIDLANIDTCSFIETKDLGRGYQDTFEVLGRFDNSDIRGCNQLF